MTIVCGIDVETTGLDFATSALTEVAWAIKEVGDPKYLSVQTHFVTPPEEAGEEFVPADITKLTKITMKHLRTAGRAMSAIFERLNSDLETYKVDYVVAHNGENFDKPMLQAKAHATPGASDYFLKLPWLDTKSDVIYPEDCAATNLVYLAAYHGFLNPFPHAALFDVCTMLRILEKYDLEAVAARARVPWVVVRALVSFEQKDLAKKRRYFWENIGEEKYPKMWVKKIKECDFNLEEQEAPFKIIRL